MPVFIQTFLNLSRPSAKQKKDFAEKLHEHCVHLYNSGKDMGKMELSAQLKTLLNIK